MAEPQGNEGGKIPWGVWSSEDAAPTADQRLFFEMLHPEENLNLFGFSDSPPEGAKPYPSDTVDQGQMSTAKRSYDEVDDAWDGDQTNKIAACGKADVAAARAKANREKQRREKLNGRFAELAALIDPGKVPKTDRNIILEDAVRVIQQLRVENNQIKQLNKFLEEKVQDNERAHGHALYRHAMAAQAAMPAAAAPSPSMLPMIPPTAAAPQAATPATLSPAMMMQMFNFMQMMQNSAAPGTSADAAGAQHPPPAMPGAAAMQQAMFAGQAAPAFRAPSPAPAAADRTISDAKKALAGSPPGQDEPSQRQFDGQLDTELRTKSPNLNHQLQSAANEHEGQQQQQQQSGFLLPKADLAFIASQQAANSAQLDAQMKLMFPQMNMPANFSFPPVGGTPNGWPPANMLDMTMDSQLRPPAA